MTFLDLAKTQAKVVVQLAQLKEEGWFEKQATMAVELFLFNGNIDKFMKVTYVFAHTGTGTTEVPGQDLLATARQLCALQTVTVCRPGAETCPSFTTGKDLL